MPIADRIVRTLKGYFVLHRSWHCAWIMARR